MFTPHEAMERIIRPNSSPKAAHWNLKNSSVFWKPKRRIALVIWECIQCFREEYGVFWGEKLFHDLLKTVAWEKHKSHFHLEIHLHSRSNFPFAGHVS